MIVAYDGSEPARRALEHAARLARRGTVVDVINVIPAQSVSSRLVTITDEQVRDQERLLRQAAALLARSGVRANLIPRSRRSGNSDPLRGGRLGGGGHRRRPSAKTQRAGSPREPLSTSLSRRTSRDVLIVH